MHRIRVKSELTLEEIITLFLYAAGVEPMSTPVEAKWLDIKNLIKKKVLDSKRINEKDLYNFTIPGVGTARILLPNVSFTKVKLGENIDFRPPVELLCDPTVENIQEAQTEIESNNEQEPDCYYFNEALAKTLQNDQCLEKHGQRSHRLR